MPQPKFSGASTKKMNAVLASPRVRAALAARAARALPRTKAIAIQAGASAFAEELHVEEGIRPGAQAEQGLKRPYARIAATVTPEDKRADRGQKLSRRQILRRGVSGG